MISNLLERRRRVTGRNTLLFYDEPLEIVRGEDVWLIDAEGRRYLDVYNNVPQVGHCHPHVVDALCRQARQINIHTRYLHEEMVRYAERLTALFDDPLSTAILTCTGTEANELALRIARHLSGHTGIIVSDFSYHGNSLTLAQATTGLPAPEALAPHVRAVPIPDMHMHEGEDPEAVGEAYARHVKEAVRSLQAAGFGVSALLFDTLFSTEGLPAVPGNFVALAAAAVRDAGGFYIADEVQPGFGRTGEGMWGYSLHGTIPDFVTMGKPMGNGHPLAGMVTTEEIINRFAEDSLYFNTFGGNPVSAAVGNAVLDVIENQGLIENARVQGKYVQERLAELMVRHEKVAAVRGRGLFFGLELVEDCQSRKPDAAYTKRVVNMMKDEGVLISRIGPGDNVLKMRPPITFQQEHADLLVSTLDKVLTKAGDQA